MATVPDETVVTQITVNYELWGAQDVQKFDAQYRQRRAEFAQADRTDTQAGAQAGAALPGTPSVFADGSAPWLSSREVPINMTICA